MNFSRAIFLLITSLICSTAAANPEATFWKWFQKNEAMLFDFEKDRETIFNQLATEMHKVNSNLTFEFGPKQDGRREFVISADGIRDSFPSVEKLYAAAPPLRNWKVIKFRPRREPFDINFQGISVKAASVAVLLEREGPKAALTVLIPCYTKAKHDSFAGIAFLLLDQALGEFDVETRVGFVGVAAPSEHYPQATPLKNLPEAFDAFLAHP
jgi:hypothetical protein